MGIMSLIVRSFKPVALLEVFNTAQLIGGSLATGSPIAAGARRSPEPPSHSEAHEDRA